MRKGGGKSKGSAFERQIAKLIVKAFRRHGIKQRECWRSVLSGGHPNSSGDLAMSDRLLLMFPYSIECKFRRRILWQRYLYAENLRQKSWEEWNWWRQAVEGSKKKIGVEVDLKPILVLKENRGPIFALYESFDTGMELMPFLRFLNRAVRRADKLRKVA